MEELMAKLRTYDWGGDRGALLEIDRLAVSSRGDEEKRAALEQALVNVLQSDAALPAKEYVCRQLALMGTARCVPALAAMLPEPELADRARYALIAIPDASAGAALRTALQETKGETQVGIVNTLGERRDRQAAPALEEMRSSQDPQLAKAAEVALRKIGPPA